MKNFVLAIIAQKGGAGKTTFAYNFYQRVRLEEPSSILIDCDDDQYSSSDLSLVRRESGITPDLPVKNMKASELEKNIAQISKDYKVIIIEFGGTINDEMKLAVKIADKIVMPLQASNLDAKTIKKVESKLLFLKDLAVPAIIVPNRIKSDGQLAFLMQAAPDLQYFKFSRSYIKDRLCYQASFDDGRSIFEIKAKSKSEREAIKEFEQLYNEVFYE